MLSFALIGKLLLDPRAWIVIGLVVSHGFAYDQGRRHEQRLQVRAIEASNVRIRDANAKEEALTAKEEVLREKAFADAQPVLAKTKCAITPELAAALNKIR